jgi:hypothetical protein
MSQGDQAEVIRHHKLPVKKEVIQRIINALYQLECETHPTAGIDPSENKTAKAYVALGLVAKLGDDLAGWAVDHLAGVSISESNSREWPSDHDSCEYEQRGMLYGFDNPNLNRRVLENLLVALSPLVRGDVFTQTAKALQALEVHEVQSILRPTGQAHGPRYTLAWLRLKALEHVAFRRGRGDKKYLASDCVSSAYACSSTTLDNWRKRDVPNVLGHERVSALCRKATTLGELARAEPDRGRPSYSEGQEITLEVYSDERLTSDGQMYKEALKADPS